MTQPTPEPGAPIRVLIVDDTSVMRDALSLFVGQWPEFEVAGTACNGAEGVLAAQTLRPDVVLMDLRMPELDGIEATRELRRLTPEIVVVMLSAYGDQTLVDEAMDAGAMGFLHKGSPPQQLRNAIKSAVDQRTVA